MEDQPRSRGAEMPAVERFHGVIDRAVTPLRERHAARMQCRRGCHGCCVDDLTVFEVEAEVIRRHHRELLRKGTPHPEGACAFLDRDGACRIYEHRPYVCRTQGLPLRWIEEEHGEPVEYRDICPLNGEGESLEQLPAEACWTLGAAEGHLVQIQRGRHGDDARVRLRDLFDGQSASAQQRKPVE